MYGVRVGAVACVVGLDGVRHVRLVVRGVEVDAVPAGGEENLCAHADRAVVVEEVGALGPVGVGRVRVAVVCVRTRLVRTHT